MSDDPESDVLDRPHFITAAIGVPAALAASADPASAEAATTSRGTVYTGDMIDGKKVISALNTDDLEFAGLRPRSACLFDPEFTPAFRTDLAIDECAGVWLLKQRAVAALLIALWCVLILNRLLSHLGSSFLNWGKQCRGSCCAGHTLNDNSTSGQRARLNSRIPAISTSLPTAPPHLLRRPKTA
jgi:hypothetical protein